MTFSLLVDVYCNDRFYGELPFLIILLLQGVCHLLNNIVMYYKEALSSCPRNEAPQLDDSSNDLETLSEYENMDLENFVFEKVTEEMEARQRAGGRVSFHLHAPKALVGLVEGKSTKNQSCEAHMDAANSYRSLCGKKQ